MAVKLFFLIFVLSMQGVASFSFASDLETPHFSWVENDPLILDLIAHPAFQRLKHIEQHGLWTRIDAKEESYSRYEHSLGVYSLLKKYGASRREQVAGLLHDVSHTAFSHVGDGVFGSENPNDDAYQDLIHSTYLKTSGLASVLEDYGLTAEEVDPKCGDFSMLEQSHPDLCADRIDYIIQGSHKAGVLSSSQVFEIRNDLHFEKNKQRWFFSTQNSAFAFAQGSLLLSEHTWGGAQDSLAVYWFRQMIQEAFKLKILQPKVMKTGCDDQVWNVLMGSDHPGLKKWQVALLTPQLPLSEANPSDRGVKYFQRKFRGVDPIVMTLAGFKPLTEVSRIYRSEYLLKKKHHAEGVWLVVEL
ncbi:MAG: HD domain-containing protein [Oligoflexales bacterium]